MISTPAIARFGLAVVVGTTLAPQPDRFTLAIVRLDGALVPFAAYDAGRWEPAWPEADQATEVTNIDNVPSVWRRRGERVPTSWRVWPAAKGVPIDAQVSGIEVVNAHCAEQVALKTSLPPVTGPHIATFGVAVDSPDVPIIRVEEVPRSDSAWPAAQRAVLAGFSRLESAQAASEGAQPSRETPAPAASLMVLYRQAGSPRSALYFIAEKKYRTARSPQDRQCGARTIVAGWLVPTDEGSFTLLDSKTFLTDCDGKEARTALPLAALRVSGRLHWVLQEHGYEDEPYVIAEISQPVGYRIRVSGGGC
jgi:hypothetical protein